MAYSQTFSYDNYGNMSCSASPAERNCLETTYNTSSNNNQISYVTLNGVNTNCTYDAAGDLTADGTGLAHSEAPRLTRNQTRRSMLSRDESFR